MAASFVCYCQMGKKQKKAYPLELEFHYLLCHLQNIVVDLLVGTTYIEFDSITEQKADQERAPNQKGLPVLTYSED